MNRARIFDLEIATGTREELFAQLLRLLSRGGTVATVNATMLSRARANKEFHRTLSDMTLRIPDGVGVARALRACGAPSEALAGVELGLMLPLARPHLRIALYGARYGVAERAGEKSSVAHIGPVTAQLVGSVVAIILLGAAFIAIGTFISSLTENQLSAAVVTIGVLCAMVLLNMVNNITDSDGQQIISSYAIRGVINWISVLSRYYNFSYGIFDFAALLYYCSISFVFLFLTVRVYEKRRWG